MSIVRRISVRSAANLTGGFCGLLGLIVGAIVTLGALIIDASAGKATGTNINLFLGVASIFFMPILYGVAGYIMMAAVAALFNLVARWTGGLEIDLEVSQE